MIDTPSIAILCGGPSAEREVSIVSGRAVAPVLENHYKVELVELNEAALPASLDSGAIVFPALHGAFGEDGTLQALLDAAGITYVGSGAEASRLCMNKVQTKLTVREAGLLTAVDFTYDAGVKIPAPEEVISAVGEQLVLKPVDQGSSIGLYLPQSVGEVAEAIAATRKGGQWMAEERIYGREFSVGVLDGEALSVVEVCPRKGVYDYESKYTAGSTEYRCPAPIPDTLTATMRRDAARAVQACGCRDFARVDFIWREGDAQPFFLEINTLPGLTPQSLLPKSASGMGLSFEALLLRMIAPAMARWKQRGGNTHG